MYDAEITKIYKIVYRTISPSGIMGITFQKKEIEADNREAAIEVLRSTVLQDSNNDIRIDKIEHLNAQKIVEKKKKKSIFGWLAFSIFIIATSAKLLSKLF